MKETQRNYQGTKKPLLAPVIDRTDGITDTFFADDVKDMAGARNRLQFCRGCEETMAKGRGVKGKEGGNQESGGILR